MQRIDQNPEKMVAGDGPEEAVHVEDVQVGEAESGEDEKGQTSHRRRM